MLPAHVWKVQAQMVKFSGVTLECMQAFLPTWSAQDENDDASSQPSSSSSSQSPFALPVTQAADFTATLCFACGQGDRQLIMCTSSCFRAFHVGCIDESAALTQRQERNPYF
ncbi:hypothetical protein H257_18723 [Aphanomyces astaci]|uniref:Zinc finger PHD-type domain-containing protein n=1 Tax=Aphanomyces astaci TaxID=112090 RepID=W4FCB2_APHAT|nr:hypothetical protein H257_18723 [Aphanomyces astaci]ETV64368.1 hypothetical protein H257_18723 [Aphanomyces astaci]|eukprot:XP_009846152.1 hypothetical protein H257_18723 [Aphanomyces astaci]